MPFRTIQRWLGRADPIAGVADQGPEDPAALRSSVSATTASQPYASEESIFAVAKELPDSQAARAYVEWACSGNHELRQRVEQLLGLAEEAQAFFQRQADCRDAHQDTLLEGGGAIATSGILPDLGDYQLLEELGRGGAGVVYKARQRSLDRLVAIKLLLSGPLARPEYVQRFRIEASAAASLRHPNIVAVHEVGVKDGYHYLVMDFIDGPTLARFSAGDPLPPGKAARLVKSIAEAIQFAHERHVLHRDLKPSNVLIDEHDQPHVTDFGLAKRLDAETDLTLSGQVLGSPGYMSPEQATAKRGLVGRGSDVYSLGAILFYLLTGRPPFVAENISDTIQMVLEADPITPRTLVVGIPRDLETICLKCLQKQPQKRYASAKELAAELGRYLNNEPIHARRATKVEKLWRWCYRRPGLASLGAATVALLLTIVVASPIALYRINQARQRAEVSEQQARRSAYVANMNLVQQAWQDSNVGLVHQLLRETAPYSDRGFEWFYWQNKVHGELRTLRGHAGAVNAAVFSPDGRMVATASHDGTARLWDPATGRTVRILEGHNAPLTWIAFSPDGQELATAGGDGTAKVWDVTSGKLRMTLAGHRARVNAVVFSPDGHKLATASDDQTAKVWERDYGKDLVTFREHSALVTSVAFSPDGQRIATGSDDKTVRVWESASGCELTTLHGLRGGLLSLAYYPDGRGILTGGHDGVTRAWDLPSGNQLQMLPTSRCAAFSSDGRFIVTGDAGGQTIHLWDTSTWTEIRSFKGHGDWLQSVAFSPDGSQILSASLDRTARLWQLTPKPDTLTLPETFRSQGRAGSAAFSPDGERVLTCGADETPKVWDVRSGREHSHLSGHRNWVQAAAFSVDGRRIATGCSDGTVGVWEASSGKSLLLFKRHTDTVSAVSFSPDGQNIISASVDKKVIVSDARHGQIKTVFEHDAQVVSVALSSDGRQLLTCCTNRVQLWELETGQMRYKFQAHELSVDHIAFSPDARRFATAGDRIVKVWDAAGPGSPALELRLTMRAWAVAFSPDGRRILTGSGDGTATIWDLATAKPLLTLNAHPVRIRVVAFSPDQQRILTGSEDHTVKIWQAATPQQVAAWQAEENLTQPVAQAAQPAAP